LKTQPDCALQDGDGLSIHSGAYDACGDGYNSHTSWRADGKAFFARVHKFTYEEPVLWTVQELPAVTVISRAALEAFKRGMRMAVEE